MKNLMYQMVVIASTLVAFPCLLVVIVIYLYQFHKAEKEFPKYQDMVIFYESTFPYCFFIDFIAIWYFLFVN